MLLFDDIEEAKLPRRLRELKTEQKRARPAVRSMRRHQTVTPISSGPWISSSMPTLTAEDLNPERDRRGQPPVPSHPGGQELQGLGCSGGAGGAHQAPYNTGVHSERQRSRVQMLR